MTWIWWAPLCAAVLHILEEFAFPGGFPAWDRMYRASIRASITPRLHILMNGLLLFACTAVGLTISGGRVVAPWSYERGVAAWLTLAALLFSNALFHLVGTIQTRRYSPGLVTGVAFYVPMTVLGYWHFLSSGEASGATAAMAALLGGSYHAWMSIVHRLRAGGSTA